MKCLSILLDTHLLNFAVYGHSFVRRVSCFYVHRQNSDGSAVKKALENVSSLVEQYVENKESIRQSESALRIAEVGVSQ